MFERPRAKIIFGRKVPFKFSFARKIFVDDIVRKIFLENILSTTSSGKKALYDGNMKLRKRAENENRRAQRDP